MKLTNRDYVGKCFDLLGDGLKPFVQKRFEVSCRSNWRITLSSDPQKLLRLMDDHWNEVFHSVLGLSTKNYIHELMVVRNQWAHHEAFNFEDTRRALDTTARLLKAVSADQAEIVEGLKQELDRESQAVSPRLNDSQPGIRPSGTKSRNGGVAENQDGGDYIPRGTAFTSKSELAEALRSWLSQSGAATIGRGASFGGTPWLYLKLHDVTVVLNSDTTRSAVQQFIDTVNRQGAESQWYVVASRGGKIRKVNFSNESSGVPGWYCYLRQPLDEPRGL